jgi:hypothetical protein
MHSSSLPPHKAIQMIGTQRSGSNLLRLMLYQLPEVYAPHPPHILLVFYPLLKLYGDLNEARNFKNLINDVCTYIELNPVKWEDADLDRKKIFAMCKRRTLLELFIQINELQCIHKGKAIWCCKSLESVYFVEHFKGEGFNPFIIYLERDGRDVAASFKKVIVGEKHIYHLALKWKADQQLSLNYILKLKPENYIVVRYEDLISHPAQCLHDICRKLGIKYNSEVLHYYQSEESKRTAESGRMWENVTKPVLKKNTNKFLSELSFQEVQIFESVAGDMLDKLGYKLSIPVSERIKFTSKQVKEFGLENERLKKAAVESASEEDRKKRKGQKEFIERLKRD